MMGGESTNNKINRLLLCYIERGMVVEEKGRKRRENGLHRLQWMNRRFMRQIKWEKMFPFGAIGYEFS